MEKDARLFCRVNTRDLRRWKAYAKRAKLPFSEWLRRNLPDVESDVSESQSDKKRARA